MEKVWEGRSHAFPSHYTPGDNAIHSLSSSGVVTVAYLCMK